MQKKSLLPLSLLFVSLTAHAEATPSNLRLSLDAGYTFMNYTEAHPFQPSLSVVNFQEQAITTNFEVLYYLITAIDNRVSRYEGLLAFMGDLSYTALPLNSNVPSTTAQVLSIIVELR